MRNSHSLTLVKIWSGSSIDSERGSIRHGFIESLAQDIARLQQTDSSRRFALVVSGAVAAGRLALGRHEATAFEKSDYAAAGQSRLFAAYADAFGSVGVPTAELLLQDGAARAWRALEPSGYIDRKPLVDAIRAFEWKLLAERIERCARHRCVAIINHNDAMAGGEQTDLLDNDILAYRTAEAVRRYSCLAVERVVFLSNTRGVLDAQGRTVHVSRMARDDRAHHDRVFGALSRHATAEKSSLGTGWLASKLATARRFVRSGVAVTLASYRDSLASILEGAAECTRLEFGEDRD